jgi:hypothetical protein
VDGCHIGYNKQTAKLAPEAQQRHGTECSSLEASFFLILGYLKIPEIISTTKISSVITNRVTQKPVPLMQERLTLECSPFIDDDQKLAKDSEPQDQFQSTVCYLKQDKIPCFVQKTKGQGHYIPKEYLPFTTEKKSSRDFPWTSDNFSCLI